jgi:hypothetical protein
MSRAGERLNLLPPPDLAIYRCAQDYWSRWLKVAMSSGTQLKPNTPLALMRFRNARMLLIEIDETCELDARVPTINLYPK